MKSRKTMLSLGAALGMPLVAPTVAQAATPAVNFHYAHNYAAGGGAPNYADIVYVGQGAYNDPGNNLWNGFGPGFTADTGSNINAAGAGTNVTLNVNFGAANGGLWFDGPDGVGGNTHQGTPFFLLGYSSLVNSANPGAGTAGSPLGTFALNNVPAGTYDVYLYGANYDSDRGAQFTVNSGTAEGGFSATLNNRNNNTFVLGENYVRFNNVTPNGSGMITGSFAPILNPNTGSNGEANFNGIQIVFTGDGSEWNVNSPGDWQTTGNWRGAVPNGVGATAIFGDRITSAHTVITDIAQTLGTIRLENASTYVLGGSGSITIQVATGSGSITASAGTQKINVPLTFASNTSLNANAGATLKISDPVTINSGVVVTQTTSTGQVKFESIVNVGVGAGLLMRNTQNMNALNLAAGGNATLSVNGSTVLKTENLSVSGTSRLDLSDNDMIVENATYSAISTLIRTARNGGSWNQPGITSSAAAAANPKNKTLGALTGAEFHTAQGAAATFDGFNVANTDILVKYTYYGDTDLNGQVNFDDYSRIDSGFNNGRTGWFNGDFDYSGGVDFDDYSLIDNAFNTQSGTLRRAMSFLDGGDRSAQGMNTPALQLVMGHFARFGEPYAIGFLNSVPEPTSALALSGLALTASKRRRVRQPRST